MTTGGYDAGYEAGIDSLIHDIYDLQDENAKLRDLVLCMWLYDYAGNFSTLQEHQEYRSAVWHRMQELGMGVSE